MFFSNLAVKDKDRPTAMADVKTNVPDHHPSSFIENEEWLAFIRITMHEVFSGETDSLKEQNIVRDIAELKYEIMDGLKTIE